MQTLIDGDLVPLEGDVVHFVRQLVEGLAYLHQRNIAHLDIKPQNLVMMGTFPECEVKLCDFEISRVILEGTEVREILGTPDYVAPEILHYEPITLAADMWSVGVTTYVLLTGFSPFGGETDQETFQNISLGEVDFPEELFGDISAQAKDFVARLLVLDPSARMTAKQCLRHDWLRGAPTQASPHLRRYLSKSREVLLERVVSRENLRRAALLSQASSQANLSCDGQESSSHPDQSLQDCLLSQSEMCLSHRLTGSRSSLEGSGEDFPSPADSRTSLNSSRTNLSCASQSCLLNKEQTQGLLDRAQSRSQANLNHSLSRGLLSRIRSLNRIQSQACLLNENSSARNSSLQPRMIINPVISKSREKLYGLRSLSKSQGVLDIYRSLECLRLRRRKSYQRARTEDILPIFKRLGAEIDTSNVGDHRSYDDVSGLIERKEHVSDEKKDESMRTDEKVAGDDRYTQVRGEDAESRDRAAFESEENLDSLKSIESDTLTEDSDETPVNRDTESSLVAGKRPCQRQHSDVSSHSNNSGTSDDKEDRSTESETEEPKYTVAQLVSAFNKHQEVASRTSLEAIMTEKRVNEVTFPTGTKALRLFIPDINISESKIVRRKTSYKPRKNWEELRKKNEKDEGILKNFVDSANEDEDEDNVISIDSKNGTRKSDSMEEQKSKGSDERISSEWSSPLPLIEINGDSIFVEATVQENVDTTIDEKYKQCVKGAKSNVMETVNDKLQKTLNNPDRSVIATRQKERLPNYIYPEMACHVKNDSQDSIKKTSFVTTNVKNPKIQNMDRTKSTYNTENINVNLKDILQRVDNCQNNPKENLENLRKRTSITKIILNDNLPLNDNQEKNEGENRSSSRAQSEPPLTLNPKEEDHKMKLVVSPSFARSSSMSSESSCPTPSSIHSDANASWEDVQRSTVGSNVSLEKEDFGKVQRRTEIQRTSSEGKNKQYTEDKRLWGRVCTGSYNRAMEKFSKNNDANKKAVGQLNGSQQNGKIRRKSSPAMPQYINP